MAPGMRGKPLAWGGDRVVDKSSLEVLQDWLAVEGNFGRWAQAGQQAKEALSYEVVSLLQSHGIRHRTFRGVWRKIEDLVRNVDLANRLLARNGLEGAVSLEGCGPLLRAEIQRRWPYYELLAPLMKAAAVAVAAQPADNQREQATSQDQELHQEEEVSPQQKERPEPEEGQPQRQDEPLQQQAEPPQSHEEQDNDDEEKPPSNQEQPEQAERSEGQPEARDPEKATEEESHEDSHESNAIFMLANMVNQKNTGEEISNVQDADAAPPVGEGRSTRSPAKYKGSDDDDDEYVPEAGKGLPRWGSDHVNGKSSLDWLIVWLTTADNYARWKAARPKSPMTKESLCSEISSLMKEHGIHHRKNIDIRKKVWSVEESFAVANQLLIARDIESLDECDTVLAAKILRHCPQYEQLAPFMSAKHGGIGRREKRQYRSRKRKQQEMEEQAHSLYEDPQVVVVELQPVQAVEETVDAAAENGSDPPVSSDLIEREAPSPVTTLVHSFDSVTRVAAASIEANPYQRRRLEQVRASFELGHDRNLIERETMREKSKMELEALRVQSECELETERKKQKLQLETIRLKSDLALEKAKFALQVTRERNEYALVVERALSRQKLMSAGLSQSEVDRILPSKIAVSENMF